MYKTLRAGEVDGLMDRAQRLKGEIAERDKALRSLRALGERAECAAFRGPSHLEGG